MSIGITITTNRGNFQFPICINIGMTTLPQAVLPPEV